MPRALGVLLLLGLALAAEVRVYPTSPLEREAEPGALITHVFRVEGEGGPYPVEVRSGAGFPILSTLRPVRPPAFLPITERVPANARAGTTETLTVRVGPAQASVRVHVAYKPGLSLKAPEKLSFWPPQIPLYVEVENTGNGDDRVVVEVKGEAGTVGRTEFLLKAFSRKRVRFFLPAPGGYRVSARLKLGKLAVRRLVEVKKLAVKGPDAPPRLFGELRGNLPYPSLAPSGSFSLFGKLSDYVEMRLFSAYYAGRSFGTFAFKGEMWRFGGGWAERPWGYLTIEEKPVKARFFLRGAEELAASLGFSTPRSRHAVAFGLRPEAYLKASGELRLPQAGVGYEAHLLPGTGGIGVRLGLRRGEWTAGYEMNAPPWTHRVSLARRFQSTLYWQASASLAEARWQGATSLTYRPSADREHRFSLSTEAVSLGTWLRLSRNPSWTLGLSAGTRWEGPASLGLSTYLSLPQKRAALGASLGWNARSGLRGGLTFRQQTPLWVGDLGLGAELRYPFEETRLRSRWVRRFGLERDELALEWTPAKGRVRLSLGLRRPLEGVVLDLYAQVEWPGPRYALRLSADYAFALEVPRAVSELFGGRKIGVLEGVLRLPKGVRLNLAGIQVLVGPYATQTDAEGRFRLELPPGRYRVWLDERTLPVALLVQNPSQTVEVRAKGKTRVVFTATVRGGLEGRVAVRADWSVPPQRFVLEIEGPTGRTVQLPTELGGRFRLLGLKPGTYRVRILEGALPPGWQAETREASAVVLPGKTARVVLWVKAPPKRVARASAIGILEVHPEAERVPPKAAPLVTAKVEGEPERVYVQSEGRVLGRFKRVREGLWTGRVQLGEARGTLRLELVAEGQGAQTSYAFFLEADPKAPWGLLRTRPLVQAGQRGVPVAVHLLAPAKRVWLEVKGRRYPLTGEGADWQGRYDVPPDIKGKLTLILKAELLSGETIAIQRSVLVR